MSGDAPPPYPGPPAPLWEEKHGPLSSLGVASPAVTQPLSMPVPPPGYGPLAYEVAQPGYIPPYMPGEGGLPYMPHVVTWAAA
ncbi:cell death-inducing p53-target protein 1 isoform X2 [Rhinatrema bivittatum]|uniref:cell death-inducing p53-target protein 1 isoform X2 n=1 Tax=Rhinatrema bivittatum TaxID=194408 RepID=UPI00112692E1|nr:cell death-inducing p53-target protein 1 isoform X2 [Rhinatrema bivittatum]XP_029432331.1 cell death-inducing p53-target protein 1 isoform X2 [Rhinatrema bivittatum]XP_029432332.1 cell death-inducing p53-target protein 1 isoform X2 [Rhinatrema bivittatum]